MKLKTIGLAAMLLATTAIVGGGVEIWANITARAELRAFLASHPGVSVARVYTEPLSGRLMLRGVAFGNDATRVTIGRLDLPLHGHEWTSGLGLVSPAAASPFDDEEKPSATPAPEPKAAPTPAPAPAPAPTPAPAPAPQAKVDAGSADEITIASGQTTAHIKHLEMIGTSLSKADLAAIFDPKSAEPAEARFKKLTASAIVIPEITIDDTSSGKSLHVTMSQVLLSGAKEGKIAAESVGHTTFTMTTGNDTSDGEIGAIQASNVDLVQFARVFNSVRSDDAEPIHPLYDSATITGIKVTDRAKHSTFSLITLRETGLKGRPLATNFISGAKDRTDKPSDAETKAALDDMLHSIEIGSMEMNDLAVRTEDKDGDSNLSLASVALHDFAKQKIGGFTLRALRFDGGEAKFGIASIDMGAFTIPNAKSLPTSAADSGAMMPATGKLDINQIDFDGVSKDKDNKGEAPKRIQFKLNHVGVVSDGEPGDLPKASKLTFDNFVFDVPPDAGQAAALIDMGYKHLDLSAALSMAYNREAQELLIDDFAVNGVNMGTVGIGLDLINVNKGIISPNKEVAKASMLAVLVKGLKLDVINAGLFDPALAWKAKQDGMTPDQERAMAVDFFANKLPASMNNNANVKKVGEAIAKFFTAPKGLHISIVSKNGLGAASMGMLADPGLLLDTLDVKATND